MKILILSHISDIAGGAEMSMLDIFDRWNENYDIEPIFILRKPIKRLANELDERGWKYFELDYGFWSESNPSTKDYDIFKNGLMNARAVRAIEGIIKDVKPDVVMTNSVVSPWAALAAHYAQLPHVWFVREYGDLDHGRVFENGREATLRDVGNLSVIVAANSKTLAEHYGQYIAKEKMKVVYTPFSIERLNEKANESVQSPFSDSNSTLKLAITGTLAVSKGQLEAIEAVGLLKDKNIRVELCVIGGNPSDEFTHKKDLLISKHKIKNQIHFVGFQQNPLAYANLADVCIMASRKEAFGRVTFEYIAIEKPVIGADSGATPEMVEDGKNGFLYKQGNPLSLANAIERYCNDRSLLDKHATVSGEIAADMMKGDNNADKLFEYITKAIKGPKIAPSVVYFKCNVHYLEAADAYAKHQSSNPVNYIRPRLRSIAKRGYHKAIRAKTILRTKK